jgi:outer membrane receptor protein involved in Fe transport
MKKFSRFGLNASAASVALGIVFAASPAFAQAAPAADAAAADDSAVIIVTGSRLPQANLSSTAPVTTVTSADLKLQGTTRVEDMLNSLPQVFAGQASSLSNGATGIATVDLRNLGPSRTLVLVNGRRMMPGDPGDSAADLNAIPSSLVKKVDVLTGGASSTYGADAVAGVVNFIMDTDFTGIQLDGQYSLYQHTNRSSILRGPIAAATAAGRPGFSFPSGSAADGGTVDATLTMGGSFDDDKGHIVGYFGYRKVRPVLQGNRDYSACTPQANAAGTLTCGGSAISGNGNVIDSTSSSYNVGPGRTFPAGLTRYNFAPLNYYQRPDERYTAGFFAHYDINDAIKPYMEFMFMDDRTIAQIAPSGDFGNTLQINCDNPLLGAAQAAVLCRPDNLVNGYLGNFPLTNAPLSNPGGGAPLVFIDPTTGLPYNKGYAQILRRNIEGGPRIADLQHTEYRGVIGSKGDLGKGWSYDAYYQYGRTVYAQTYSNEFSTARLNKALDAVRDPATGNIVCRSALDKSDSACVPYDVFGNNISQAALNYVQAIGFQRGTVSEQVANASITGLLGEYGMKTPWANDGVSINFGAEYRKESLSLVTDQEFSTGDLTGQGSPTLPINGNIKVVDFFGEARLPIVQDGFIKNLSLEGGYRHSQYYLSTGGGFKTNTYKIAAEFSPISDIGIRASYNRAVRAPNVQELFATQHVALDGVTDPCAGGIDPATGRVNGLTAAQCAFTGVSAAQFGNITANPAAQYNGLIGGEPRLKPEKATTKTLGVVLQPSFLRRFSVSVDYFDIKVKNSIQLFGADSILSTCAGSGAASVCNLIHRNPVNGSLWLTPDGYVTDINVNVGGVKTSGIDVNANYGMDIGTYGGLSFSFVGTYLDKFVTDNGIATPYDCAGYFGATCGTPAPKWRHKARVTWNTPVGASLSLGWRYFKSVKVDSSSSNPSLATTFSPFGAKIPSQSYFDLASTVKLGDNYTFRLGVQNLLDKRPPLINSNGTLSNCPGVTCNGGTFPSVYDALGRYIYAGVTLNF